MAAVSCGGREPQGQVADAKYVGLETLRSTGSGVVRIYPLCFLAGCRTRRLNQALSVLSLILGFF